MGPYDVEAEEKLYRITSFLSMLDTPLMVERGVLPSFLIMIDEARSMRLCYVFRLMKPFPSPSLSLPLPLHLPLTPPLPPFP